MGDNGDRLLGATLHAELLRRSLTLATAESLTGGAHADHASGTPGASETFRGVVSARCAEQMAAGVRSLLGADWAVSTTGVAGPTEQEGKPVGTVFVGVAGPDVVVAHELHLDGDRAAIRAAACRRAAELVVAAVTAVAEDTP